MTRPLALLLLCVGAPALAAGQFDLACQGTQVVKEGGPPEATAFRVRVDLAGKLWCMDKCERALDIDDVTPDKITFQDDGVLNTRQEITREASLDRKSGKFHRFIFEIRPQTNYLKVEATCSEQPFTPFPSAKP